MELTQHIEYHTYVRAREVDQRCRRSLATWRASGEPIVVELYSLRWTPGQAQAFVHSLSHLFQEYNRVLWERFPYCRRCGGQCCVVHATRVGPFDSIALALLGQSLPILSERIEATARACIYHTAQGCAWPAEWRPVKCWSFYCALGDPCRPIAEELKRVVVDLLPDALRRYEAAWGDRLVTHLDGPVSFANVFKHALSDIFVAPFTKRFLTYS